MTLYHISSFVYSKSYRLSEKNLKAHNNSYAETVT